MMNKALRFIEILWLGVAAVSAVEIYVNWGYELAEYDKVYTFSGSRDIHVFPPPTITS